MSDFTFTANSITVAGKTFPAEYSITKTGAVMVFVRTAPDAEPQRVRFPADHADHAAALAAYNAAEEAAKQEQNAAAQRVADAAKAAYAEAAAKLAAEHEQEPPAAPEMPRTFPGWTGELHQGKALAKRLTAAGNIPAAQIHLDQKKQTAEIVSRDHTHTVTLKSCTCGDFIRYKMPCKHMYRLARDLGLLATDWNAAETVKTAQEQPAAETVQATPDEQPGHDLATGPVPQDTPSAAMTPAKDFIGTAITGHGWRILFDAETSRTRVMFDAAPTDAARAAVENAGFYFSKAMNSYNKKLTCKAHRAALALSGELQTIYA